MNKIILPMLLLCAVAVQSRADVTVWVKAAGAPHVYAWDSENNAINGAWSETTALTTADDVAPATGQKWWLCVLPDVSSASIIIHNGVRAGYGNGDNQSADIENISGTHYYDYDGGSGCADITGSTTVTMPTGVVVNDENFPDDNFRAFIHETFTYTRDNVTYTPGEDYLLEATELNNYITSIDCKNLEIQSLEGIQHFANLGTLNCSNNSLGTIDLSGCARLSSLTCSNCELTSLTLPHKSYWHSIDCKNNSLTTFDLTGVTELHYFYCDNNQFESLDFSGITSNNFERLECSENSNLKSIIFGSESGLASLRCTNNENLSEIDLTPLKSLKRLYCWGNPFTTLDISKNTELEFFSSGGARDKVEEMDFTNNTKLKTIYYTTSTDFKRANLAGLENLETCRIYECALEEADLSDCKKLNYLELDNNNLTKIVLDNPLLTYFRCHVNPELTELDCSGSPLLETLECHSCSLTKLDVSTCADLKTLRCEANCLRALDLSHMEKLNSLSCSTQKCAADVVIMRNQSIGISYPAEVDPSRVDNMGVNLTYPNLGGTVVASNLGHDDVTYDGVNYHRANGLTFDQIQNVLWSHNDENRIPAVSYSYDTKCPSASVSEYRRKMAVYVQGPTYVVCGEDNGGEGNFPDANFRARVRQSDYDANGDGRLTREELQPITTVEVPNMEIADLAGIEYMKYLTDLDCNHNRIAALNLVYNTELTNLDCSHNEIASLSWYSSWSSKLRTLNCSHNQIGGLTLDQNISLYTLNCSHNNINELDVSKNYYIRYFDCSYNEMETLTLIPTNTTNNFIDIDCSHNNIKSLETVRAYRKMTDLNCGYNQLEDLTLTSAVALVNLNCEHNQIAGLALPYIYTALKHLDCNTNQLAALATLKNYTNLEYLDCSVNLLPLLDVTRNTLMTGFHCGNNLLTELDLSKNTLLTEFSCNDNHLTALDLSAQAALETLDYSNQTRDIQAESAFTYVKEDGEYVLDENGKRKQDKYYYLRLDDNCTGDSELPVWDRMSATNYGGVASSFDPSRLTGWVSGAMPVSGSRKAANPSDVTADGVYGNIVVMTDVNEDDDLATGAVQYTYAVQLPPTATATDEQSAFTLNWSADATPGVVTAIEAVTVGSPSGEGDTVTYYNLAGRSSDRPFEGVNIVVTRHADGTTTTSKVIR